LTSTLKRLLRHKTPVELVSELELGRNPFFDDISALASDVTGYDGSFVGLMGPVKMHVVGVHNRDYKDFRRMLFRPSPEKLVEVIDFGTVFASSSLADGTLDTAQSITASRIDLGGDVIGYLVTTSRETMPLLDETQKANLERLVELTQEVVREKISLRAMLGDVFALANF